MQKIKSMNWSGLLNIIKCCLIGIVTTLLGTVIFAFVLKFLSLSSKFIAYINDIIKVFSILNGSFVFNLKFLYDLLFSVIVSMIISVIINIVGHKNM